MRGRSWLLISVGLNALLLGAVLLLWRPSPDPAPTVVLPSERPSATNSPATMNPNRLHCSASSR